MRALHPFWLRTALSLLWRPAAPPAEALVLASLSPSRMTAQQSRALDAQMRQEAIAERVNRWLRRRYPSNTSANVEADTGISARAVSMWLQRGSAPGAEAIVRLTHAYGPEFFLALMGCEPPWLDDAVRAEEQRELLAHIKQVEAMLQRARP